MLHIQAENRFNHLLEIYTNNDYRYLNRVINGDYEFIMYNDINSTSGDIYKNSFNNFALSFQSDKQYGYYTGSKGSTIKIDAALYKIMKDNVSTQTSMLDTSLYHIALNASFNRSFLNYYKKSKYDLFVEMIPSLKADQSFISKKTFDSDLEQINDDTLKSGWSIESYPGTTLFSGFTLTFGAGREKNVTPVYQALRLEKKWVESRILKGPISDSTFSGITRIMAQYSSFLLKKNSARNSFKKSIDSIMIKDSSVDSRMLRYISPLVISKSDIFSHYPFIQRNRFDLFTICRIKGYFERQKKSYPYDVYSIYDDTVTNDIITGYEQATGFDWHIGIPLKKYWFLDISARKYLLSFKFSLENSDFIASFDDQYLSKQKIFDSRWDIINSFWVSDHFSIVAGVKNLPLFIISKEKPWIFNHPYLYYTCLDFFAEDIFFSLSFSYYNSSDIFIPYYYWSEPFIHYKNGFSVLSLRCNVQL